MPSRFSIRTLLLGMIMVAFSCALYIVICRNGISEASVMRIKPGMHKSELIEMLGKPHRIYPTGYWEYDVWGFSGFALGSVSKLVLI